MMINMAFSREQSVINAEKRRKRQKKSLEMGGKQS